MAGGNLDDLEAVLGRFLREDLGAGDVTTEALVLPGLAGVAEFRAKQSGVLCGLDVAGATFAVLDSTCRLERRVTEGQRFESGDVLGIVRGPMAALLGAERTALNLLQRMSGTATLTARFVDAAGNAVILDTRKTAPGLRWFDKRAVATGGGVNHRSGLYDQVLIKENHLAAMSTEGAERPIEAAVRRARAHCPDGMVVEIEVLNADEAVRAARAGADLILLDNFSCERLAEAVERVSVLGLSMPPLLEASGGIDLRTVAEVANTGVDRISVGALTHSAPAADISLIIGTGSASGLD